MLHLPSISTTGLSGATSSKLLVRAGPGRAASHQPHDFLLLLDCQHHDLVTRRGTRDWCSRDEEDLAWRLSASRLAEERERRARLAAACDRPSRGEVGGQPIDGENEALRYVDGFGAAIEIERDIVNERGAGRDDHCGDRKAASTSTRVKPCCER